MSTLKLDTFSNFAGTKSVPANTVIDGSAKAWVNFFGTGTPGIRAAFNVSSITDNGVGDYTINITTPLADGLYGTQVTLGAGSNTSTGVFPQSATAAAYRFLCLASTTPADFGVVAVSLFR